MRNLLRTEALFGTLLAISFLSTADAQTPNEVTGSTTVNVKVLTASGTLLAGAMVSIAGTSAAAMTTANGLASLAALSGRRFLHVRKLGYEPFDSLLVLDGAPTALTVSLRRAVEIDSIHVVARAVGKPARYSETTKFDEFYERRATAVGGSFFTREDIERANQSEAVDLLHSVPGVQLTFRTGMAPLVYFARCGGGTTRNPFAIGKSDPIRKGGEEELGLVQLFIDGHRVSQPFSTLASLHSDDIEAMEVYQGVAQLPAAARGDGCAAIFIWTRYSTGDVLRAKKNDP